MTISSQQKMPAHIKTTTRKRPRTYSTGGRGRHGHISKRIKRDDKSSTGPSKGEVKLTAIQQEVFDRIIKCFDDGKVPWHWSRPWSSPNGSRPLKGQAAISAFNQWKATLAKENTAMAQVDKLVELVSIHLLPHIGIGGPSAGKGGPLIAGILEYLVDPDELDKLRASFEDALATSSYQGVNALTLNIGHDYDRSYWMTFKNADALDGCVKKGEHGRHILYSSPRRCFSAGCPSYGNSEDECVHVMGKPWVQSWSSVFNVGQMSGDNLHKAFEAIDQQWQRLLPPPKSTRITKAIDKAIDKAREKVSLVHDSHRAYYDGNLKLPTIRLPAKASFVGQEYYMTTFHELIHFADHQLAIEAGTEQDKGDDADHDCNHRSTRELIAEIGAGFLAAQFGLEMDEETLPNIAAYIASWSSYIRQDTTKAKTQELTFAAGRASRCVTYLMTRVFAMR